MRIEIFFLIFQWLSYFLFLRTLYKSDLCSKTYSSCSFGLSHLAIGEIVRNIGTLSQIYSTLLLRIYFNGHVQPTIYDAPRTRLIRHTHTHPHTQRRRPKLVEEKERVRERTSRVAVLVVAAVILFNVTHDASCFYLQQPNRATLGSAFACMRGLGGVPPVLYLSLPLQFPQLFAYII